ncbi:hypothetical protein [Liquorilactobacillus mali]|uniref:hypothetical protein n=1 Tax=Liquorilactobacillus mali TaxID=1618 RepID=UPI0029542687|nr:hypothetical protein [Liquorilactobacillus mali]MDV7756853.1 hypothetical protein [Liquorilactobacillus mali]
MKKTSKFVLPILLSSAFLGTTFISQNPSNTIYAKATQATLGAGTFTVGKKADIKPGRYVIKSTNGSGNLSDSTGQINVILGQTIDNDSGQIDSYTTNLKKGDQVQIQGIESTSFTPAGKRIKKTILNAGDWKVGKDIKSGRYIITALQGSGNLSTNDGMINEILGTTSDSETGQVSSVTAHLTKGEILSTNLEQIKLTKK